MDIHFPPSSESRIISKVSHLAIGAHQDDIEIMAGHGITHCLNHKSDRFASITMTDGRGSAREGEFANYTDEEMAQIRYQEQKDAADIGKYEYCIQLGHSSKRIKNLDNDIIQELTEILKQSKPEVIYLHNPADKHPTHVATLKCCLEAIKKAELPITPRVLGCEVWRGLDWMNDHEKVSLNLTGHEKFLLNLLSVFKSQIAGGKRYDLATLGRMRANATYFDSHSTDQAELVWFALDLTPLISNENLNLKTFLDQLLANFKHSLHENL